MRMHLLRVTSEINKLAKYGKLADCLNLFNKLPHKDAIAWNSILTAYSHAGVFSHTLFFFNSMRLSPTTPDDFSFTAVLRSCAAACSATNGGALHSLVILSGFLPSVAVGNSLVYMYAKCSNPHGAHKLFDEMRCRNGVTWCSLLFSYTNSALFHPAREVFDGMPDRSVFSWNTMIAGYARCGEKRHCFELFVDMVRARLAPDGCTLSAVVSASVECGDAGFGHMIHGFVAKSGWGSSIEVDNSIMSFYSKRGCRVDLFSPRGVENQVSRNTLMDAHMRMGDTSKALEVFASSSERNAVSWTCMMSGYVRNREEEHALGFFADMSRNHVPPDEFTFAAALRACSRLSFLRHGEMVHGRVIRYGVHPSPYVGNGLVDMYAKCGDIKGSMEAFADVFERDLVSWNAMLFGLSYHGMAREAANLYDGLVEVGLRPDWITYIGLLVACAHSGDVERARVVVERLRNVCKGRCVGDHVFYVMDMLGRGGNLEESLSLVKDRIGYKSYLEAFLGACFLHENVEMGSLFRRDSRVLDMNRHMGYVILSNLYCLKGEWEKAEYVRKEMMDRRLRKVIGYSWIQIKDKVEIFVAGDNNYSNMVDFNGMMKLLEYQRRYPC